ncbi:MAG: GAF domain-containing protein, partial [Candidatus Marinimicrobia bacterium]|nr:GAF domain-containing protein [Candidatus Neomarinimicrobiota bacterium]
YVFNLNPIPGLDWTPLAFGISGLILIWGVYNYQLLSLIPVARHKLVETMVDGVMVIDTQGRIVDLNPAMETIIGVPADKVLGHEAAEVLANWEELLYCLQDGKDTQTEIQLVKNNLVLFYDLLISTIFYRRNLKSGQLILLRNITRYKFAENEFRELFQNMRSGVAVYQSVDEGRDFVFKRLNAAAEHLTQIKSKDAIGKKVTTVFPGIKEFGLLEVFKRVWRTGKPEHYPTRLYKDERISLWFANYVYKLPSEEIVAVFNDITNRKHNEVLQHVIFQIAEAATTVSAMDELYQTIHQLLGKIINVNNFYIALYDQEKQLLSFPFCKDEVDIYPKPKPLGRGLTEYMIHTGKSLFLPKTEFFKLVEDGEIELIGTPAELYLGTPLKIKNRIIGVLAVQSYSANDVYSEKDLQVLEYVSGQIAAVIIHKQAEEIIRKSEEKHRLLSEELGKANSLKELLLDVISHDLKNPAGIIRGFAEIAVEEDPDNDILKYLYTSSNNLLKVIDNAAILSKVGVGDEIDKEELDLIELIEIVVGEFSNPLDELNIDLEINSVKPLTITANPIISEVFRNYISNAIKYAGTGKKIIIDVKQNRDYLIAEVTDFGKTVPKRDYKRIFTRKYQLEHGHGRGLGLAIVKRIAEAHNAEVGVKPNRPTGNIFYLKIRQK